MKKMLFLILCASNALFAAADDEKKVICAQRAVKEIGALLHVIKVSDCVTNFAACDKQGAKKDYRRGNRVVVESINRLNALLDCLSETDKTQACRDILSCKNDYDQSTVVHLAVKYYGQPEFFGGYPALYFLKKLSLNRGDLSMQDNDGNTPLHLTTYFEITNHFLAQGACVHIRNNKHLTPLEYASAQCHGDRVKDLLSKHIEKDSCGCIVANQDIKALEIVGSEKEDAEVSVAAASSKGSDASKSKKSKSKRSRTHLKRRIGGGRY